jgi:hypothetical protein
MQLTAIRSRLRAGFTLVEILVVLVFMGLFVAAMVKLLLRQQRFYNSTGELIRTRQQIRQAAFMLPADLRGMSRLGGDIYAMTDSSIEFRSVFGSSVACVVSSAGQGYVTTVPVQLVKGSAMTNWKVAPAQYDSVMLYDDGTNIGSQDDLWRYAEVSTVTLVTGNVANGCPTTSRLDSIVDLTATNPSYNLKLSVAPPATMLPGAALRFYRRVHYSLYKWATDGNWYLAYYDCLRNRSPVCNNPQPIAGPLRPYAAPGTTSGLEFTYYDSTGAVTANKALVARISLVVRAQGQANINLTGAAALPLRDSLRIEVGLRNRN